VSLTSAINVGQAVDNALDVHADFDALFEEVRLVEKASGFDLVAVEADKDIAGGGFFAGGATTLIPEGTAGIAAGNRKSNPPLPSVW
jgi:hypothetical protein